MKKLIYLASLSLLLACTNENPRLQGSYPAQKPPPNYPIPPKPPQAEPPVFPEVVQPNRPNDWKTFERDFAFFDSEATAQQAKHNENQMSVFFQVQKDGHSVNTLTADQLKLTENGTLVTGVKLGIAEREKFNQAVDIMLMVDVTRSMGPFIESAKKVLRDFIRTSAARGYHTRMCISTFGDRTVKQCTRFFDNNPKDPSTRAQVRELLSELSNLRAARGSEDPGGNDIDENPMGALIDASKAPWGAESQRFVIMVTDAPFLFSPDNQGAIGENAPTMTQTNDAVKASQMKVFAVTPTHPGYNSPFQGQPGVVQASGGEHNEFRDVVRGRVKLDSILERILMRVNTTYKASYIVEKSGLNPTLSVEQRKVEVALKDPSLGNVGPLSVQSSVPTGRAEYKDTFQVADSPIAPETLKVFVNGQQISTNEFSAQGGDVRFSRSPAPGAKLKFVFQYQAFEKNLRMVPMTLPSGLNTQNTRVFINDIQARPEDVILANDLEGVTSLSIADSVLAQHDPYKVREQQRIKIKAVVIQ